MSYTMPKPSLQQVLAAYRRRGYTLFLDQDFDLNIFGIRTNVPGPSGKSRQDDEWDDFIGVIWRENGEVKMRIFEATTDPGLYYLSRKHGGSYRGRSRTAIMKEGQHRGLWARGRHRTYSALRQKTAVPFYVDRNLDSYLDMGDSVEVQTATIYANLHSTRPRALSNRVWNWSAACQVIRRWDDFQWLMALCDRQIAAGIGNSFSYTLFTAKDFR